MDVGVDKILVNSGWWRPSSFFPFAWHGFSAAQIGGFFSHSQLRWSRSQQKRLLRSVCEEKNVDGLGVSGFLGARCFPVQGTVNSKCFMHSLIKFYWFTTLENSEKKRKLPNGVRSCHCHYNLSRSMIHVCSLVKEIPPTKHLRTFPVHSIIFRAFPIKDVWCWSRRRNNRCGQEPSG